MRWRQPLERRGQAVIRDIVRFGDPRLLAENAEVDPAREELAGLVADMVESCHAAPGVGLAAPQIGVNKRVAIIDLSVGADPNGVIVLVNPVVLEVSGEQKEEVTFVDVDAFGKQAETIGQYMRKGSAMLIEGRLRLDQWDDKQTGQKRQRLGVVCENFRFVGSAPRNEDGSVPAAAPRPRPAAPPAAEGPSDSDVQPHEGDDVPF